MADKTYKNAFDDGYTTYHDDGTTSHTYKNVFDDGTTTYNSDGSTSHTYKNVFDDGMTTYNSDGSTSHTYKNVLDDGYTTYNSDGSTSHTYQNVLDNGYTTYTSGGYQGSPAGGTDTYGGPYYGGGATPYRHNLGLFDYVLIIAGIAAMGAALQWRCGSIPYLQFGTFIACVIANIVHIKGGDTEKQETWNGFLSLIALTMNIHMCHFLGNEPAEILPRIGYWVMPVAFAAIWLFVLHILDEPDSLGLVMGMFALLFISWYTVSFASVPAYWSTYCVINDGVFILMYAMALLYALASLGGKNTKILVVLFPVVCYLIFSLQKMITGFQGILIMKDYITGLF